MPFFKVAFVANRLVETFAHLENFLIIFQGPVIKIKQKNRSISPWDHEQNQVFSQSKYNWLVVNGFLKIVLAIKWTQFVSIYKAINLIFHNENAFSSRPLWSYCIVSKTKYELYMLCYDLAIVWPYLWCPIIHKISVLKNKLNSFEQH